MDEELDFGAVEVVLCVQPEVFLKCYSTLVNHLQEHDEPEPHILGIIKTTTNRTPTPQTDDTNDLIQPKIIRENMVSELLQVGDLFY